MSSCTSVVGLMLLSAFLLLLLVVPQDHIGQKAAQVLCTPSKRGGSFRRHIMATAGCEQWNTYLLDQPSADTQLASHNTTSHSLSTQASHHHPAPKQSPSSHPTPPHPLSPEPSHSTRADTYKVPDTNPSPAPHHLHPISTHHRTHPRPTSTLPSSPPSPGPVHVTVPLRPISETPETSGPPVVKAQGIFFSLEGMRFTPVGTNWYDAHVIHKYSEEDIIAALKLHASKGVNVIRVFAHLNGGCVQLARQNGRVCSPIQPVAGKYNEVALQRLDFLLDASAAVGIRLILSMVNFWSTYHDGGMKWYVENARTPADGQDMEYFFTDPHIRQLYKKYIATLVQRVNSVNQRQYRLDGTVFAWELANEPHTSANYENNKGLEPGRLLWEWAAEMSYFIKHELHVTQMVCTGGEGYRSDQTQVDWYGWMNNGVKGMNFTGNTMLDTIDFATVHAYFMSWGFMPKGDVWNGHGDPYKMQLGYAWGIKRFLQDRARIAHSVNKPILMEEFGVPDSISDWCRVYDYKPTRSQYLRCIVTGALEANFAGFLYWEITPNTDNAEYIISYKSDGADILKLLFAQQWDDIMTGTDCTCPGTRLGPPSSCNNCACDDLPYVVSTDPNDQRNQPCHVHKTQGRCDAPELLHGNYCAATCGRCSAGSGCPAPPPAPPPPRPIPADCTDEPPVGAFTCHQQAVLWHKCCESWMQGKCNRSCQRCTGASKEEQMKLCGGAGG